LDEKRHHSPAVGVHFARRTPEMRHQGAGRHSDIPYAMGDDEITFEDLFAGDMPVSPGLPGSFPQLLDDGFPLGGGLPALAAIAQLAGTGSKIEAARRCYLEITEQQIRAR
jgi:hypothetical protein